MKLGLLTDIHEHNDDLRILENVPPEVTAVYLAEDCLETAKRAEYEAAFADVFGCGPDPPSQ